MGSCRSTRTITTVVSQKDSTLLVVRPEDSDSAKSVKVTFEKIYSQQITFNTFSSKVKIDYSDDKNNRMYNKYKELSKESNVIFGGRLAEYKYYDMHQVIGSALSKSKKELK